MACNRYQDFVGNGTGLHLNELKNDILVDITETIGIEPKFGIPDNELFNRKIQYFNKGNPVLKIKPDGGYTPFFFEGNDRIYEFEDLTWQYHGNRNFFKSNTRGLYFYKIGTIFLRKPLWCRHVLTHEILHGTSVFSRIDFDKYKCYRTHESMIDGITETLTGYILYKKYPECYEAWKTDKFNVCNISGYKQKVRLWCSVSQHIGINALAEFYLSEKNNLKNPWNQFQNIIIAQGFTKFNYPLDIEIPWDETVFRETVMKAIPNLRETYDNREKSLDFSEIPR